MRLAIAEAELARGTTGNNPWVGCAIVSSQGKLVGLGHTLGPGEDHAEVAAARYAEAHGQPVRGCILYSTLEPCSFHGRTPACARAIAERGIARVVVGIRDPNPRVDGQGIAILREAGVLVSEGICESAIRQQLGPWVLEHHPHELVRQGRALPADTRLAELAIRYAVAPTKLSELFALHGL